MKITKENIETIKKLLDDKAKKLEVLEEEKADIIARFEKADTKEQVLIKKEMDESIKKYKSLSEEVKKLTQKIKLLKEEMDNN